MSTTITLTFTPGAIPSTLAPVIKGETGLSAYEEAVASGFVGDEAVWLLSLHWSSDAAQAATEAARDAALAAQAAAEGAQSDAETAANAAGLDALATAADRIVTAADRDAAALSALTAAGHEDQTTLDAIATAADRVQTGLDRSAAAESASAAAGSALTATTQAGNASSSAATATTKAAEASSSASTATTQASAVAVTYNALTEREGYALRARNTQNTLAMLDRQAYGANGAGNPRDLPKTITASQTAAVVTASAAVFTKEHVGNIIVWSSGEEALITAVDNEASGWNAITTCTVDRSQTVSSGTAKIDAKPLVGVYFGDSIAYEVVMLLIRLWYRAFGFGGYILRPNGVDLNSLSIAGASLAGGATEVVSTIDYATMPWSAYWSIPAGGSVTAQLLGVHSLGVERELNFGIKPENLLHDTCLVVWRRGAGSITIERKRIHDANWEFVETVADTSTGARAFNFKKYTHSLRVDWQYRVTGVSGTVRVAQISLLNRTTPGFVAWPLSRGGVNISDFDAIPSAELSELVQLNMPDFRTVFSADAISTDPAVPYASLSTDRALWSAAAPRTDNIWLGLWTVSEANDAGGLKQRAWNSACRSIALENDENYISFDLLYQAYATGSSARGWLRDSIHSTKKGQAITAQFIERALGFAEHPLAAEGRNVNARNVVADAISLRGRDLAAENTALRLRNVPQVRGAKWKKSPIAALTATGAFSAAIGAGDFSLLFDLDVLSDVPTAQMLATISSNIGDTTAAASSITVYLEGNALLICLKSAANVAFIYKYNYFCTTYGGARRTMVLRSNRANARFDVFVDGLPAKGMEVAVTGIGGAGDTLSSWVGTGVDFGIPQSTSLASCSHIYGVMAWLSALSDSEIYTTSLTGSPITTPEFNFEFDECGGRVVLDKSGNGKDAIFMAGNPNQYLVGTGPTWKGSLRGLAPPWVATLGATSKLIAGDDVTHKYAGARDYELPDAPKMGDMVRLTKAAAQTVRIGHPALHQIKTGAGATVGTNATTVGTSGKLTLVGAYDSVTLKCVHAEAGVSYLWVVVEASSALTFA